MVLGILRGLKTTLGYFFRPKVTVQYPNQKRAYAPRFRGRHELTRYDNGLEKCVGCELCAGACPSNCITVVGAENDPEHPHSPGERYGVHWEVNLLRCIFCGYCQEACPTGALHLSRFNELAEYSREKEVYTKERLLEPRPGVFNTGKEAVG